MAATTTGLVIRPAIRRAPPETASNPHETELSPADNAALSGAHQGFGDTDYHLLRSHALLERLQQAVSARVQE